MNVLYVVPSISQSSRGIFKKQYDKTKAFEKAGCVIKTLLFSDEFKEYFVEKNIFHIPLNLNKIGDKYSKMLIWRILPFVLSRGANKVIYNEVKNHLEGIDIVYIRYSGSDINFFPLLKLMKKLEKKIVFEYNGHHYNDEVINVKATPSIFTYYKYINESLFQKKTARYANLIVGVTDELTNYYGAFTQNSLKYTLSNGIDVSRFPIRNRVNYDGTRINFLFLSGSVNYWHGLDRFLNSLINYRGNKIITVTIAGPVHAEYKKIIYENTNIKLVFMDSVAGEVLDNLFNHHHIGIGSLALHRMKLTEASVLKVREYIARGLPFIIGYNDTDLYRTSVLNQFYLQVPADESLLDFNSIIDFAESVLNIDNYSLELKSIGTKLIDYQPKINGLIECFKNMKIKKI